MGHLHRRPWLVKERLDQADLKRRHEHDLRLPLAREEIDAGHHASLLRVPMLRPLREPLTCAHDVGVPLRDLELDRGRQC